MSRDLWPGLNGVGIWGCMGGYYDGAMRFLITGGGVNDHGEALYVTFRALRPWRLSDIHRVRTFSNFSRAPSTII